ncbi:MAG: hypothetical protein KC466_01615 [Myxococcales bacterium]|nr:hypothetical protein [Myxococcales bacterium]
MSGNTARKIDEALPTEDEELDLPLNLIKKLRKPKIHPDDHKGKARERQPQNTLKAKATPSTLVDLHFWDQGRMGIFTLKPSQPLWDFKAGQYTSLGLDVPGRGFFMNAYSIASSPAQRDVLEFLIVLVHGGTLTPTMFNKKAGAKIGATWWYMKPVGNFHLGRTQKKNLFMIGTGTGVAPFHSMVKSLIEQGTIGEYRIICANGVRWTEGLGYRADFEAWQRKYPDNVLYLPTISRPEKDKGFDAKRHGRGRVDEVLKSALAMGGTGQMPTGIDKDRFFEWINPAETAVLLCGHPGMCAEFGEQLRERGHEDVLTEDYW